ncbi:hypothetical protein, partial [Salmonella sp. s51933]|uniref:WD40 domain-containing protein n=1 Tax=Salmonella sp. s51933 TaxID=3160127 RepID=UPI0037545C0C
MHSLDNNTISDLKATITLSREASVLAYSPDGAYLGIGQADKEVVVYSTTDHKEVSSTWITHSSRITSLSWTSDSLHLASGSLDSNVAVWTIGKRDNV